MLRIIGVVLCLAGLTGVVDDVADLGLMSRLIESVESDCTRKENPEGSGKYRLPDVTGMHPQTADECLDKAGFKKVKFWDEHGNPTPRGELGDIRDGATVTDQSPKGGESTSYTLDQLVKLTWEDPEKPFPFELMVSIVLAVVGAGLYYFSGRGFAKK